MSYEIVKGIKIENGKVFVKSDSNNVYPKDFHYWESPTLSKILQEKGEQELDIEILKTFEEGNFQCSESTNNKYMRALKVLHYLLKEEYKAFDWRTGSFEEREKARNGESFKALLLKALNMNFPKEKFIVKKSYAGETLYARKKTSRHLFYTDDISQAKEFDFKEQAEEVLKCYGVTNGEVLGLTSVAEHSEETK